MEVALRNHSALPLDPDIVLCLNMSWSWWELMATPPWVVEDLRTYWHKRALVDRERRMVRAAGGGKR
jgi:hypothetical protein